MASPEPSAIALALGRIPTGLFIVTTRDAQGSPIGFVGSFLVQVGFQPPTVCLAIARERAHLALVRHSGRFGVSILDEARGRALMAPFFKKTAAGRSAFDALKHHNAPGGSPVLDQALAWIECRLTGEHVLADHVVVFGEVDGAALQSAAEPAVHLRKNGLGY